MPIDSPEVLCVMGCDLLGTLPGCPVHNPIVRALRARVRELEAALATVTGERDEAREGQRALIDHSEVAFDEIQKLGERVRALEEACRRVLVAADNAPPVHFIAYLSKAVDAVRAAISASPASSEGAAAGKEKL